MLTDLLEQGRGFVQSDFDYSRNVAQYPLAVAGLEVKNILPSDSVIEFSSHDVSLEYVDFRYNVFPVRIGEQGGYVLYRKGDKISPAVGLRQEYNLSNDYVISAKPGFKFIPHPMTRIPWRLAETLLWVIVWTVMIILPGRYTLRILKLSSEGLAWSWATSYLIGSLFLSSLLWVFLLFGGEFSAVTVFGVWGVLTLILVLVERQVGRGNKTDSIQTEHSNPAVFSDAVLALVVAILVLLAVTVPVMDWDGMSLWVMKAKVIYYNKGLNFNYTHNNFYPIAWPIIIASQFALAGKMLDPLAQWSAAFFCVVFVLIMRAGLQLFSNNRRLTSLLLAAFLVGFYSVPGSIKGSIYQYFISANAENIFLAYFSGMITAVLLWIKREKMEFLILAMMFGIGLTVTKLEGGVAFFFCLVGLLFISRTKRYTRLEKIIIGWASVGLLLPLGWIQWVRVHEFGNQLIHIQSKITMEKIVALLSAHWRYSMECLPVGVSLGFLVYVLVFSRKPWDISQKFLGIVAGGMLFFSFVGNIGGLSLETIKSMFPEAFPRLFLHAMPAVILFCVSRISAVEGEPRTQPPVVSPEGTSNG